MKYGDPRIIDAVTLALQTFRFGSKNLDVKEVASKIIKVLSPEQIPALMAILRGDNAFSQIVIEANQDAGGFPLPTANYALYVQARTTFDFPAVLIDQLSEGQGLKVTRLIGIQDLPTVEVLGVARDRGALFARADTGSTGPALALDNRGTGDTIVDDTTGARLTLGGIWLDAASTRDLKDHVEEVSDTRVLRALGSLSVPRWRRRGEKTLHLSPMLDEFHRAFGIGERGESRRKMSEERRFGARRRSGAGSSP